MRRKRWQHNRCLLGTLFAAFCAWTALLPTPATAAAQAAVEADHRVDDDGDDELLALFYRMDNVVMPGDFDAIIDMLGLSDAQREAVQPAFDAYFERVTAIAEEMRANHEASKPISEALFNEPLRRGEKPDYEALDRHMRDRRRASRALVLEADRFLDDFLTALSRHLEPGQRGKMAEVGRFIRYQNERRMRQAMRGRDIVWGDLANTDAPRQFMIESIERGGPLAMLSDAALTSADDPRLEDARSRYDEILDRYELKRDEARQRRLRSRREPIPDDYSSRIPLTDEYHRRRGERWSLWYNDTLTAVHEVGELIAELHDDPSAYQEWMHAFRASLLPRVLDRRWLADELSDWLAQRNDATAQQIQLAADLHERYLIERRELEIAAFDAGVAARRRFGTVNGTGDLQLAFHTRIQSINRHHERTLARFRDLLTESQRADFDAHHNAIQRTYGTNGAPLAIRILDGIAERLD